MELPFFWLLFFWCVLLGAELKWTYRSYLLCSIMFKFNFQWLPVFVQRSLTSVPRMAGSRWHMGLTYQCWSHQIHCLIFVHVRPVFMRFKIYCRCYNAHIRHIVKQSPRHVTVQLRRVPQQPEEALRLITAAPQAAATQQCSALLRPSRNRRRVITQYPKSRVTSSRRPTTMLYTREENYPLTCYPHLSTSVKGTTTRILSGRKFRKVSTETNHPGGANTRCSVDSFWIL